MREHTLKVFNGGNEGPVCEPCVAGCFLDEGRDDEVKALLREWAEKQRALGRITACTAHHEDIAALGIRLEPLLKEARKQKRATKAVKQRAHRQMVRMAKAHVEALARQQKAKKDGDGGPPVAF